MKGVPEARGALLRRGVRVRERRRPARLPPRRPRLDAARQGAGRLPAARAGGRAGLRVRPDRASRSARYLNGERRAGDDGGRPALPGRLPARRPLPADHARARRRPPHRARRRTRGRWSRATWSRSRSPGLGRLSSTVVEWDVDLTGAGAQLDVTADTIHVALAVPEDEAERMAERAGGRDPPPAHRPRLPARRQPRRGAAALVARVRPARPRRRRARALLACEDEPYSLELVAGRARPSPHGLRARAATARSTRPRRRSTRRASTGSSSTAALHLADPDGFGIELVAVPRARAVGRARAAARSSCGRARRGSSATSTA